MNLKASLPNMYLKVLRSTTLASLVNYSRHEEIKDGSVNYECVIGGGENALM